MSGEEGDGRLSYDPARPDRTYSYEDAQAMLQMLFAQYRETFGKLNYELVTGEPFTYGKRRVR